MHDSSAPHSQERDASACRADPTRADAAACFGSADAGACDSPADCTEASEDRPACPSPLSWRDVVAQVDRQAERFVLPRPNGRPGSLRGLTLGTGPTVIMSNGLAGNVGLFALLAWVLRENHRCVLWEYADSDTHRPAGRPGLDAYVDDLLAIAGHFASQPMCAFGVSFGALVTAAALAREPNRFSHAVLTSPSVGCALSRRERWVLRQVSGWRLPLGRLPFWRHLQSRMHGLFFPPFDHSRLNYLAANLGRTPVGIAARRLLIAAETDIASDLAELRHAERLRLCVIAPEGEAPATRQRREQFERTLAEHGLGSLLHVEFMHTSGLYPHLTHPHRLRKLLDEFITGTAVCGPSASQKIGAPPQ